MSAEVLGRLLVYIRQVMELHRIRLCLSVVCQFGLLQSFLALSVDAMHARLETMSGKLDVVAK